MTRVWSRASEMISAELVYLASRRAERALDDTRTQLEQARAGLAELLGDLPAEMPMRAVVEALLDISDRLARTVIDLEANALIAEADFKRRFAQLNLNSRRRHRNSEQLALSIRRR